MPTYMNDTMVTEDIRVKITPAQREWVEQTARRAGLSMNQVVRRLIIDAMRASEGTQHAASNGHTD